MSLRAHLAGVAFFLCLTAAGPPSGPPGPAAPSGAAEAQRAAATGDGAAPIFQIVVRPATSSHSVVRSTPDGFQGIGLTLPIVLGHAYGLSRKRMTLPEGLPEGRYDFLVAPGRRRELRDVLLRSAIDGAFGIRTFVERRETGVYVLAATPDALRKLNRETGERIGSDPGAGSIETANVTLDALALRLEEEVDLPVVNETGLEGEYDVHLTWNPSRPGALQAAVREQLGLDLRRALRRIRVLTAERSK